MYKLFFIFLTLAITNNSCLLTVEDHPRHYNGPYCTEIYYDSYYEYCCAYNLSDYHNGYFDYCDTYWY